jgi:hypothetical protein
VRAGPATAAKQLEAALTSGDFSELGDLLSADAMLDANLQGGRIRVAGAAEVVAQLTSLYPGEGRLLEWSPRVHPGGIAVWFERHGNDGTAMRQRHYLEMRGGRVVRHWVYTAPPRTATAGGAVLFDTELVSELGEVAEHRPMISRGWSGNALEQLVLADGRRLVAKRIVPGTNWIDRHTRDEGREALLFTSGVLSRLPETIDHAVVTAVPDGEAWWVVMRDVSGSLLPDEGRLTREEHRRMLAAANGMWEEFWDEPVPHLCTLRDCLQLFSPVISEAEREGVDLLPKQYEVFWEAFAEAADRDVADAVRALVEDPGPLVTALDACGSTLVHADIRDEQIGLEGDRLVLLDWGRATQAHPVLDFFWSLCHNGWRIDADHDELVEDFRRARGDDDDPYAVELGVIAGLVLYGWVFGHSAAYHPDPEERDWARGELAWWVPRARRALETWSP